MGFSGARLAVLAAMLVALATAGSAAAQENERGIDPNQGRSLVEVNLPDKAAAIELQLEAESTASTSTTTTCARTRTGRSPSPSSATRTSSLRSKLPATSSARRSRVPPRGASAQRTGRPT